MKLKIAILGILLAIGSIAILLSLCPPLLPSDATATATINGKTIQLSCETPLFFANRIYVRLPEGIDRRYRDFIVEKKRKVVTTANGIYKGPLGVEYIHADQSLGISLTFPKIEDIWKVNFSGHRVAFSNSTLAIEVHL